MTTSKETAEVIKECAKILSDCLPGFGVTLVIRDLKKKDFC